jgi:DNA-binding CsgD family transcriptional regulator
VTVLTDGLRWNQAPTRSRRRSQVIPKPPRPASRVTPGQLHLVDVPAAADAHPRPTIDFFSRRANTTKGMTTMATSNQQNGSPWSSLRARQRERVAVALRVDGYTYAEIGDRLGISDRMASRIVNRAMSRVLREPVAQLIDLESARLDALWAAMWPKALAGSARHAEVCVRISERRARLLGLDQPTRVDANVLANVSVDQLDAENRAFAPRVRPGWGRPVNRARTGT